MDAYIVAVIAYASCKATSLSPGRRLRLSLAPLTRNSTTSRQNGRVSSTCKIAVYPEARVEFRDEGLGPKPSRPPVAEIHKRPVTLLPSPNHSTNSHFSISCLALTKSPTRQLARSDARPIPHAFNRQFIPPPSEPFLCSLITHQITHNA